MAREAEGNFMTSILEERLRLRQENELLRAALAPFAKIPLWRDRYPDAKRDELEAQQMQGYIKVEDVRNARQALG